MQSAHPWPGLEGDVLDRGGGGELEVGVGADDERRLAAELEEHPLEVPGDACPMIAAPTTSDPVKVTMSTRGSVVSTRPTSASPVTTLSVPGGSSAASAASARTSAEKGVNGDGLSTTVLPIASAGPTFQRLRKKGKLKGVMAATTPTGSWRTTSLPSQLLPSERRVTRGESARVRSRPPRPPTTRGGRAGG